MPPWLAFERRIFVKRNLPDVLRTSLRHGNARHADLARGESLIIVCLVYRRTKKAAGVESGGGKGRGWLGLSP